MASALFVGNLSELVPPGILPHVNDGLGIDVSQTGFLISVYALVAATPVVSATLAFNRKRGPLVEVADSNVVVRLSSSHAVTIVARPY